MSFGFLRLPPRLPVEAELLPGRLLRIMTERKGGKWQATEYAVEDIGASDDVIAEQLILWGGSDEGRASKVQVRHTGEINCSCDAFLYERCAELGRHCKHSYAAVVTGLITSVEAPAHDPRYCEARS